MSNVYIFDAVHTVLKPVPNVIDCYFDAGKQYGSSLTKDELKARFSEARNRHFAAGTSAAATQAGSLTSSDEIESRLWETLIRDVFADVADVDSLFQQLWQHFASSENWELYDDVDPAWNALAARGDRLVIASNFDSRLYEIVKHHKVFSLAEAVFCSAEVGFRKPDPMFYQHVADALSLGASDSVTMIGDDFENDYAAPRLFGWNAFHLDRRGAGDVEPIQEGVISSLSQLL